MRGCASRRGGKSLRKILLWLCLGRRAEFSYDPEVFEYVLVIQNDSRRTRFATAAEFAARASSPGSERQ